MRCLKFGSRGYYISHSRLNSRGSVESDDCLLAGHARHDDNSTINNCRSTLRGAKGQRGTLISLRLAMVSVYGVVKPSNSVARAPERRRVGLPHRNPQSGRHTSRSPLEAQVGTTLKQQPAFSIRTLKIQKQSIVCASCTASHDVCGLLQATVRAAAGRCVRLSAAQLQCRKGGYISSWIPS